MKVLCVGDVVGPAGLDFAKSEITRLKQMQGIDFVIVNAENSDKSGVGLTRNGAQELLQYADVLTTGNHAFRRTSEDLYLEHERVLCPANFPYLDDEAGCCIIDLGRLGAIRVINLIGTAWMEPVDNPFKRADELLAKGDARFTIVDFHAESTAEKKALGYYLAGRVSAVFGTHTHVQTADEQLLEGPQGSFTTGYLTDVGMTGPGCSVIGVAPGPAVHKQRTHRPARFEPASGPCVFNAVVFTLDDVSGHCTSIERLYYPQQIEPDRTF